MSNWRSKASRTGRGTRAGRQGPARLTAVAARKAAGAAGTLSKRGRMMSEQPFHHGEPGITAFHPGLPDADNFPFNTWSKLLARRTKQARSDLFGSYHITGYPPLCEAIARYLTGIARRRLPS